MALQSMTALASITLQEASTSVSFSGIPQNYRDLILIINAKTTTGDFGFLGRFNSDSGNNYSRVRMGGNGSTTYSTADTATSFRLTSSTTNVDGMRVANIMDYSATDKHKTVLVRDSVAGNNVAAIANRWANTVAVTSLDAICDGGSFAIGSTFNLYGRIA